MKPKPIDIIRNYASEIGYCAGPLWESKVEFPIEDSNEWYNLLVSAIESKNKKQPKRAASQTPSKPVPEPLKVNLTATKLIEKDDLPLLSTIAPEIVLAFFRNRLVIENMGDIPSEWLNKNCMGFYMVGEYEECIAFERDEDMLLFHATFQGTTVE